MENAEGKNTNTSEQTITPAPDTAQPEGGNGVNAHAEAAAETAGQAPGQPAASADASDAGASTAASADASDAGAEPAAAAAMDDDAPEELSAELIAAMDQARAAEADGPDKAADAWRAVIARDPSKQAPWRELARVLRAAEKWRPLSDALKDEEQQAARSPRAKGEVLRELADIYRDQLRNEQQAIATLTRIVEVNPRRLEVYDELAAFYDSKKRWPDLVATLSKKAENLPDPTEQVALYLQIANLYIERFSNQAEAIKAFERVLEVDPDNQAAIAHLLDVYEKRRDWEKLIGLREKQIDTIADANERAEKTYEVAKLAATRVKKPEVCVVWWEKVLVDDPGHEEAMTELYKLYERNKSWDKLADICEKQAAIAPDEKTQADALQKLGLLYTEKVEDNAKAVHAWRRLLLLDDQNRRAQDALKKLYITIKDWNALEEFYRSQEKIEEYVRVIERQVEAGDEEDRLPLAMKIAVLYRDELDKADRAMRAFEKVLSLDENNLEAAEALIPLYADGRDPKKLVRVLEIQLAQTQEPELRIERTKRLAEYNEDKLRDKAAAFGWYLKA
ncbi:MAG TPA: tetratricopeptide repeat protein, partial [Haliangium sp.]|nr:tetratricopeptide repeat protein [Haliangium sp.]